MIELNSHNIVLAAGHSLTANRHALSLKEQRGKPAYMFSRAYLDFSSVSIISSYEVLRIEAHLMAFAASTSSTTFFMP